MTPLPPRKSAPLPEFVAPGLKGHPSMSGNSSWIKIGNILKHSIDVKSWDTRHGTAVLIEKINSIEETIRTYKKVNFEIKEETGRKGKYGANP